MSLDGGDQTRGDSTPFVAGVDAVILSRGEVVALCTKAARGAGMAWGLAEEAGFAAGWLAVRGQNGPGHLLAHISAAQGRPWADLRPVVAPGAWHAPSGGAMCPIALGAALSDHAALPAGPLAGRGLQAGPVDHPVLLMPFLSAIAASAGLTLTLAWQGGAVQVDGQSAGPADKVSALHWQRGVTLRVTVRRGAVHHRTAGAMPSVGAGTIAALNAFALRTTVPASDSSRAGAGATTTDDD